MDAAAPPALAFRRRSTLARLLLDPALEIGAGGEAVVYGVPGDGSLVAKLYHAPSVERARKLAALVSHPPAMPAGTAIAWPGDVLLAERGGFAGFLMPRADGPRVFEFYNPVTRRATAPRFHAGLLHRAGRNLAAAFHALHEAGYVVGDVNESNLLVSPADASVTLVDADSLQVRDGETGAVFRSRVGKPEFTPPELLGVRFGEVDRTPEHDRFGLAVLVFLLLMEGTHPFAARMAAHAEAEPVEERIRCALFPHAARFDDCHPPRLSPRFDALHPPLCALFLRAFVDGHADPSARPSSVEWRDALEAAEAALAVCADNPLHLHAPHLDACPWCERRALLGGRDPFPGGAEASPKRPTRLRAPAAVVSAPAAAPAQPSGPMVMTPFGPRPAPAAPAQPPRAAGGVTPFGMTATSFGPVVPFLFSRAGLPNPLVLAAASAVLAAMGSRTVSVLAAAGLIISLGALVVAGWWNIRRVTVILALAVAAAVAMVAGLAANAANAADRAAWAPLIEPPSPLHGAGLRPPGDPALMLPELRSVPVSRAPAEMPNVAPAGEPGGASLDVRLLDRRPRLLNEPEAARALATAYARTTPRGTAAGIVVVWMRVEPTGGVVERQVLSTTSQQAADAVRATTPYLRFAPGEKGGVWYATWVTQRFVIVP